MHSRWITAVVALSAAIMTLDMTVVTIALPAITGDLSANLSDAQWIVNGYVLVFAALLLGVGALSDHMPRHRLFIAGHVIFGLASLLCAAAPTTDWLIFGRVVQAIGATMVFATCMPIIADAHVGDEAGRARAVGAFMAAGAGAAALGPLFGGLVVGGGGWRWIFAINLPVSLIAIVAMVLIGRHSPDTPRNSAKVSWSSTVLVAMGLFALNYALVSGPKDGWASATVIIAAIAAVALLAAFVILQLRLGDDALLDLRLFKVPSFTAAMILSFTARLVTFGVLPYLVFWLSGVQGRTAIQVGLVLLALALPMVVVAAPSSALEKTGKLNLVTGAAMVITGVGLLWLGLIMDPSLTWKTSIFPLLVIGIGAGVAMPHMMNLALAVAPADRSGAATGATNTAFPLGTAVGVAIFGAVLSSHVDKLDWAPEQVREAASEGRLDILAKVLDGAQLQDAIDMFTGGLSVVLLMAAGFAAVCAVICFAAIRNRDRIGDGAPADADDAEPVHARR